MTKINFIPSSNVVELSVSPPVPAKISIPKWFKDIKNFYSMEPEWDENNNIINKNLKMCQPFLDSLCLGYIQTTWCDIYIEIKDNQIFARYSGDLEIFNIRESRNIPLANNYYPIEFFWKQPWIPKTSDGYSVLVCHPLNRIDLPFETTSGVIDSDKFYSQPFGSIPFYIKNGFTGLIPMGTPMYQIIPFKRDIFKSSCNEFDDNIFIKGKKIQGRKFWNSYKKFFWTKKQFN